MSFLIDYHKGVELNNGEEEFYLEILQDYLSFCEETETVLRDCLKREDWENYKIRVHTLKGNSRLIGADGLGEHAYRHQMMAEACDCAGIRQDFEALLQNLRAVTEELRKGDFIPC